MYLRDPAFTRWNIFPSRVAAGLEIGRRDLLFDMCLSVIWYIWEFSVEQALQEDHRMVQYRMAKRDSVAGYNVFDLRVDRCVCVLVMSSIAIKAASFPDN